MSHFMNRPESQVDTPGAGYVPTQEDWDEVSAHFDDDTPPNEGEPASPFDYCDDDEQQYIDEFLGYDFSEAEDQPEWGE